MNQNQTLVYMNVLQSSENSIGFILKLWLENRHVGLQMIEHWLNFIYGQIFIHIDNLN